MQKTTLITGSGRGIGAAAARLLAHQGHQVCVNAYSDETSAQALLDELTDAGCRAILVMADVSDEAQVSDLFAQIDAQFGPLTGLVNNAGRLMQQSRLQDISVARFEQIMHSNVTSCFLCCREAVKRMSTAHGGKGGAIVNVSSAAARTGSPFEYVDYAASKGAMDTLTKGLALEVAAEGIRVNGVRPGFIHTDMHADGGEPDRVKRLQSAIPMQRGGEASEVAEAIAWLLSEKASYATGTFIDLAGGR